MAPMLRGGATLTPLGTYDAGDFEGGAEIVKVDPASNRAFVTNSEENTVDILDISDPSAPALVSQIDLSGLGDGPNSVDVYDGTVAVAVEVDPTETPGVSPVTPNPGVVGFFDIDGAPLGDVEVGVLPDMLTFTPDGDTLLVAIEAEPVCGVDLGGDENEDIANAVDPVGGVSIIDLSSGDFSSLTSTLADFTAFDAPGALDEMVRVFWPGSLPSQDLEPEFISLDPDGSTAYVSLQENNALGVLDVEAGEFTAVVPLGYKDHSQAGNELDPSDRDDPTVPQIATWPVQGMYQPDTIASWEHDGAVYTATANEGDARDYDCYSEEERIDDLNLGGDLDPALQDDDQLGRLQTTTATPTADPATELFSYGARSFSIWDAEGALVWDSGSLLETHVADAFAPFHNSEENSTDEFDGRSDNKGPEPEALAIGNVFGRNYAFVGLERVGGVALFDVTDPMAPAFESYVHPGIDGSTGPGSNDVSPEGMDFVPASESPTGTPLLVVASEVSSTTTIYELSGPTHVDSAVERVVDSRGNGVPPILDGKLTPNQPAEIDVADLFAGSAEEALTTRRPFPAPEAGEAGGYVFNLTATEGEGRGFASMFPCAAGFDTTSNVNFPGEADGTRGSAAALVVASPDADGKICVQSNRAVHIVADFAGWLPEGQGFVQQDPFRLLDLRDGSGAAAIPAGQLTNGTEVQVQVAGLGGLPETGISAVALNLVGTEADAPGWLAAYSCAAGYDGTSTLNYLEEQSRANFAIVPVDEDGTFCLQANKPVFAVADVLGYFSSDSGLASSAIERIVDSRIDGRSTTRSIVGKLQPGVVSRFDANELDLGADTTALAVNLTSTEGEQPGWLAIYACEDGRNSTSNLNFQTDQSTANAVIVPLPSDGELCVEANKATHVVIDLIGGFELRGLTANEPLTLNLLHMNDHHSHLQPDGGFGVDIEIGLTDEVEFSLGGFPNVVSKFKELEAELDNTVKIHAGDAITGTLFYTLFQGEADAAMMNQVCFDMFALGNHEFDDGDEQLANGFLTDLADPSDDCPDTAVLGANVVPQIGTPLAPVAQDDFIQPYVVKEYEGQQVGFIGIDIAQKTQVSSQPLDTTEFRDEVETAQFYVDELAEMGIHNVVLVTHQGYQNDIALASQVTGVDAIVGGDSHSLLGDFEDLGFDSEGDYPTLATNADGERVCIVQAWQYSHVVGQMELTLRDGRTSSCRGTPHLVINDDFVKQVDDPDEQDPDETIDAPLTDEERAQVLAFLDTVPGAGIVTPDAEAQAVLDEFADQVDVLEEQEVATAGEALCLNRLPGDDRSVGTTGCSPTVTAASGAAADVNGGFIQQIVTDAFLARAFRADMAIQNAGGVRIPIPAGPITIGDVYTLLPFSNTLVELTLTGQEIDDVLEQAIENFLDDGGSTGSYPYGSGIRYDVDLSDPTDRVQNVEVKDRDTGVWSDLDLAKTDYVVVTNSFIASGRDGYDAFGTAFDEGRVVDTFIDYAQGFFDYLEEDLGGGTVVVPAPEDFSTQSFTPAP